MSAEARGRELKRPLGRVVDRHMVQMILDVARQWDINRGGLWDARSGCANVWASPEDKPACWDVEITKGALEYPRAYVGALGWDWVEGPSGEDRFSLYVETTPYDLSDERRRLFGSPPRRPLSRGRLEEVRNPFTMAELECCLGWVRAKALELLRLVELHPEYVGLRCPWCPWILPPDKMLNELVEHVGQVHPEVTIQAVVLDEVSRLRTDRGEFPLERVESF